MSPICRITFTLSALCLALSGAEAQPVQTFTLTERFGVSHPDQILDFDLAAPVEAGISYLLGPNGEEVPYQSLEGGRKLALRTDLQAEAEKTWRLMAGLAEELTGMTVTFRERGHLLVIVEVAYDVRRPAILKDGQGALPAGPAHYTSTITVQAGQPSILFEEEADVTWSLDLYPGLAPNQARYQGHHSKSPETGYEADGQQYRMWHQRSNMDAFRRPALRPAHALHRPPHGQLLGPHGRVESVDL